MGSSCLPGLHYRSTPKPQHSALPKKTRFPDLARPTKVAGTKQEIQSAKRITMNRIWYCMWNKNENENKKEYGFLRDAHSNILNETRRSKRDNSPDFRKSSRLKIRQAKTAYTEKQTQFVLQATTFN